MSSYPLVLFSNPFSPIDSFEAKVLQTYISLAQDDILKEIQLQHYSLIPLKHHFSKSELVHSVHGSYPHMLYKQSYIERHNIIQFCKLRFNLDADLNEDNMITINSLTYRVSNQLNLINILNQTQYAKKSGIASWFQSLNPWQIINQFYRNQFVSEQVNLQNVVFRSQTVSQIYTELNHLISKQEGSVVSFYDTFRGALVQNETNQICSLDIVVYVILKYNPDNKENYSQLMKWYQNFEDKILFFHKKSIKIDFDEEETPELQALLKQNEFLKNKKENSEKQQTYEHSQKFIFNERVAMLSNQIEPKANQEEMIEQHNSFNSYPANSKSAIVKLAGVAAVVGLSKFIKIQES